MLENLAPVPVTWFNLTLFFVGAWTLGRWTAVVIWFAMQSLWPHRFGPIRMRGVLPHWMRKIALLVICRIDPTARAAYDEIKKTGGEMSISIKLWLWVWDLRLSVEKHRRRKRN